MSLVCVPIQVDDVHAALAEAHAARDAGADLVEYRVDGYFHGAGDEDARRGVLRLAAESPLPCIVTCRPTWEGGDYDGDDTDRVALFEALGTAEKGAPRYIDVELEAYTRSANLRQKVNLAVDHPGQRRDISTSLILSSHDFTGRPADLFRRLARMQGEDAASVLKIAFMARSVRDALDALALPAEAGRPTIALAMGPFGLASRVLAPKFGGFLTFASLRDASATAPGQPTIADLLGMYRFRSIDGSTGVYGVIGWPVEHSLSPAVHNAGFESIDRNAVYLPLPVAPGYEPLKATLDALIEHPSLGFRGCSVTMPHKENLVRFGMERRDSGDARWTIDQACEVSGAANTLLIERDASGEASGCRLLNTDATAAAACLRESLGDLRGTKIGIIGAGGVARAIAAGCLAEGATVALFNRTHERAQQAAQDLSGHHPSTVAALPIESLGASSFHALVNATPIGMADGPAPDESAIPDNALLGDAAPKAVFETVYAPARTPTVESAERARVPVIRGLDFFVRQAAEQFNIWTGERAPEGLFLRVCQETLASRESADEEEAR